MTDHELLELAANAGGIRIEYIGMLYYFSADDNTGKEWNPLKDDGDALRLAVKLNLPIHRSYLTDERLPVVACHKMYEDVHEEDRWQWIFVEDDSYTATRRAIVMAAAEIGKTK